jgi:hypothetical protein
LGNRARSGSHTALFMTPVRAILEEDIFDAIPSGSPFGPPSSVTIGDST